MKHSTLGPLFPILDVWLGPENLHFRQASMDTDATGSRTTLRTWPGLQSSAWLAPNSHPTTHPPSTLPKLYLFSFHFLKCIHLNPALVPFHSLLPKPGTFLLQILITGAFFNVSVYLLLCLSILIGSNHSPSDHPVLFLPSLHVRFVCGQSVSPTRI